MSVRDVLSGHARWHVEQCHVLDGLAAMPDASVHLCITSPPYYQLREYPTGTWEGGDPDCDHRPPRPDTSSSGLSNPTAKGAAVGGYYQPHGSVCLRCGATRSEPTVWYGATGSPDCAHEWRDTERSRVKPGHGLAGGLHEGRVRNVSVAHIMLNPATGATCRLCGAWRGALGAEPVADCMSWSRSEPPCSACYICHLRTIFAAVRRVLRDDGLLAVNIGDSYSGTNSALDASEQMAQDFSGAATGNLLGIPSRLALALQADGWIWRSECQWAKDSAMPEATEGWRWTQCRVRVRSVRVIESPRAMATGTRDTTVKLSKNASTIWDDCPGCPKCEATGGYVLMKGSWRPTRAHEPVMLFAKQMGYYADSFAVRTFHAKGSERPHLDYDGAEEPTAGGQLGLPAGSANLRTVWRLPQEYLAGRLCLACGAWRRGNARRFRTDENGRKEEVCASCGRADAWADHFAGFPPSLPDLVIRFATSEAGCCPTCGAQWARVLRRGQDAVSGSSRKRAEAPGAEVSPTSSFRTGRYSAWKSVGWRPVCSCPQREPLGAIVLDPFSGSGTTGIAALRLGRRYVGLELAQSYVDMSRERIDRDAGYRIPLDAEASWR